MVILTRNGVVMTSKYHVAQSKNHVNQQFDIGRLRLNALIEDKRPIEKQNHSMRPELKLFARRAQWIPLIIALSCCHVITIRGGQLRTD